VFAFESVVGFGLPVGFALALVAFVVADESAADVQARVQAALVAGQAFVALVFGLTPITRETLASGSDHQRSSI